MSGTGPTGDAPSAGSDGATKAGAAYAADPGGHVGARRPFASIVIPVRDGEATIGDCLEAVLAADYPAERREVLVVDNGSSDRTAAIVERFPIRLVREPRPGAAHARNRGVETARGEIVVFLDSDCLPSVRWLAELLRPFDDPGVAATAGELVAYPPRTAAERYVARRKPLWQRWTSSTRYPWFLIGNSAVRREVFEHIGVLDPAFASVGCEDIDFSWRFMDAGLELRQCPRAIAFHRHRATLRSFFEQQVRNGRGQALLCRKHPSVIRWGWRRELAAWRDLGAGVGAVLRTVATRARGGTPADPGDATVDLVRRAAQRIGFVDGMIRGVAATARGTVGAETAPEAEAAATPGATERAIAGGRTGSGAREAARNEERVP